MELSRIVLGLRAEPQSVYDSLSRLLAALQDEEVDERDAAEGYVRELARLAINWMARADERSLAEVHRQIDAALVGVGPVHPANRYLPDAVWVGSQVRGIALVISTYLRTDNLAKSLGFLAGRRRESWRRAVERMGELRRPVTAGELAAAGVFDTVRNATHALTQLGAYGLVERAAGGGTTVYTLTWAGENAAKVLAAEMADRLPADDEPDDSDSVSAAAPSAAGARAEAVAPGLPRPEVSAASPRGETGAGAEALAAADHLPDLVQEMVARALAEALGPEVARARARRAASPHAYAAGPSEPWDESPHAPTAQGGEQAIRALALMEVP